MLYSNIGGTADHAAPSSAILKFVDCSNSSIDRFVHSLTSLHHAVRSVTPTFSAFYHSCYDAFFSDNVSKVCEISSHNTDLQSAFCMFASFIMTLLRILAVHSIRITRQ